MERKIFNYCAVLGVDGMGNFNKKTATPRMDALFENGAVTWDALSMDPTISAENWGAMLLGATPVVHGLTNGFISRNVYTNRALPSVFTRIRRAFPEAYLASVCNWDPINYGIVEHDAGVDMATAPNDEALNPLIIERVMKKPKFLFVQYDDVDGAGHGHDYGSPEHLAQITFTDGLIGQVLDAYRAAGIYDETLFIVLADHGGIRRGHGGYTDGEKFVFFGAAGQGLARAQIGFARTVDIAATVLYALGMEVPAYDEKGFSSQVPRGIFPWYTGGYVLSMPESKTEKTRPTPNFGGEDGLAARFGRERVKLAMFFDNTLTDETGNCAFTEDGRVKFYSNGVCFSCAEFGQTGCCETRDLRLGEGSFTLAVWLLTDRALNEECVVCGNKDWWWQKRREPGFSFVLKNNDTVFALGSGSDDFALVTPFPDGHGDGWLHAITAVDKEKKEIRVYYDFRLIRSFPLEDAFCGSPDNGLPFTVGNDVGHKNNIRDFPNIFRMDDLLIFGGAFTDADAAALEDYYRA